MIDRVRIPRRSRLLVVFGTLAFLVLVVGQAPADIIIEIEPANTNAQVGSAGNVFDVLLDNTGSAFSLASFEVTLSAPSGSSISFTGADTITGQTYVFANDNSGGFTFSNPGGPNTADIFDFANDLNQTVSANTLYGLGEIFFNVSAGATPGAYSLTYLSSTGLTGGPPNFFPVQPAPTTQSGQITVTPVSAVPEPSSLILLSVGMALGGLAWPRRGRSA